MASSYGIRATTTKDHAGDDVVMAWDTQSSRFDGLPPFSFPVYFTTAGADLARDPGFPALLLTALRSEGVFTWAGRCRFDLYSKPHANILACLSHARCEVDYRNRNGILPHLPFPWTIARQYRSNMYTRFALIVDCRAWSVQGLTLVDYDPLLHTLPRSRQQHSWYNTASANRDIVKASRIPDFGAVASLLHQRWEGAGNSWTEKDLERRNNGGFSPALYPAMDPASHEDADGDHDHDDVGRYGARLPPLLHDSENAPVDVRTSTPSIIDVFDQNELWNSTPDAEIVGTNYTDSSGYMVESVWLKGHSISRPELSVTLYLAKDMPNFTAQALFKVIDTGWLRQDAWALDIVRGVSNLDRAYEHHLRETDRRTSVRTAERRRNISSIISKLADSRLPEELLELVESNLISPALPDYSSMPPLPTEDIRNVRGYRGMFLYLDSELPLMGPLLVFFHPVPLRSQGSMSCEPSGITELRVVKLRLWHRVSDALHSLWTFAAPHST